MKLKCDLIIQNLNNPSSNSSAASNNDRVHKSATISLYRTRQESEDEEDEENSKNSKCFASSGSSAPIILTVETKNVNLKYKLKRIETYTKFISEGKATLKLIDENVYLLLSNSPSLTLINFFSFISIKLAKTDLKTYKPELGNNKNDPKSQTKSFVNRLLNSEQCTIGKNSLTTISPLCEKEINDAVKTKSTKMASVINGGKYVASPIRASGTFTKPSSTNNFKKSISDLSVLQSNTAKKESKLTKHASSTTDLLVQLTDEQKRILKAIKDGYNVFFTGSGGSGKSFLINIIRKCLPHDSSFVTASTGVAASLINGITLHTFAGLSGSENDFGSSNEKDEGQIKANKIKAAVEKVLKSKEKSNNWRICKHLIIDEISMVRLIVFF